MARIIIYIDNATLERVEAATKAAGVSRSVWITDAIQSRITDPLHAEADADEFTSDFPTAEEIRALWGGGTDED